MTFDQWTATPMGAAALSLAKSCDTFREASIALKAAWDAGRTDNALDEPRRGQMHSCDDPECAVCGHPFPSQDTTKEKT